jgi:hypothetical protein
MPPAPQQQHQQLQQQEQSSPCCCAADPRAFKPEYEKAATFLLRHSSVHVHRLDCAVDVSLLWLGGSSMYLRSRWPCSAASAQPT